MQLRSGVPSHQRQLLTLIAISAVLVVPGGILNWQQSCSNGACQITAFNGEVVSTSFWTTIAWMLPPIALPAVFAVVAAVTTRTITAQLAGGEPSLRPGHTEARPRPDSIVGCTGIAGRRVRVPSHRRRASY